MFVTGIAEATASNSSQSLGQFFVSLVLLIMKTSWLSGKYGLLPILLKDSCLDILLHNFKVIFKRFCWLFLSFGIQQLRNNILIRRCARCRIL